MIEDEPEREPPFHLIGPDRNNRAWMVLPTGDRIDLGETFSVAEVLSQWLGSIDYDEVENP